MSQLRLRLTVAVAALVTLAGAGNALAAPSELSFSEYVEGSSNNKALEIYNGTGSAIDLGAGSYNVQMYFNGSSSAGLTINLTGTVVTGDVFVLAHSSADAAILAEADLTNGSGWFNGDDAVVLRKGTTVLDVIGQIGVDPGTEWGSGLTSTADNTLRRKSGIEAGDANGADAFDPAVEWDGFATDTFTGLGAHGGDAAPRVTATVPENGADGVARDANITVTFSEPVTVEPGAFEVVCATSGSQSPAVTGGPTTFTLDPPAQLAANELCAVTVRASLVRDVDTIDPPDTMAADHTFFFRTVDTSVCGDPATPVGTLQGTGATTPLAGQVHSIEGVVVADHEGASPALRGFYLQDGGDGNPATSDGIFVFNGGNQNLVSTGDRVRVSGTVGENQGQTQVSTSAANITVCGTGSVSPTVLLLPAAQAELERYEGMLVTTTQTLYVTEHFQLGRFGQVVLSSGDRLYQPTTLVEPGAAALALQAQNDQNRLILDDSSQFQNPDPIVWGRNGMPLSASNTLRGGDTVTGAVGVLTYTWGGNAASPNAFRLRPLNALGGTAQFVAANPRPTASPDVAGRLKVVGMNVLNFFNTIGSTACTNGVGGSTTDCRGADSQLELDRQWPKTVAAIIGTGAHIVGLGEIENDGYGPDSAIAFLVDKLNEATAPGTWAFVDADAGTGELNALGTDAIKVGLLYKPGTVTPVGTTAALNSVAFVNGGDGEPRNRPALAQAFRENATGSLLVVSPNHLKSKGSACDVPDAGDGQGNCAAVRTNAAILLAEWLASDPTGTGAANALIIGDLNSYAKEDPIAALEERGYTNLIAELLGDRAYSYVFDGQWGYLDHALANEALRPQVVGVEEWHINADEPAVLDYNTEFKSAGQIVSLYAPDWFRMSDHDPVVVGLDLAITFAGVCTVVRDVVTKQGIANALCAKLAAAAQAAARGNMNAKDGQLGAFVNQVEAQTGKSVSAADAAALIRLAESL